MKISIQGSLLLALLGLIFSSCKTPERRVAPVINAASSVFNLCVSRGYIASNESKIVNEIQRAQVELGDGESRNFLLARLKDVRPEALPKEVFLESLFSGAKTSVLKNDKLVCFSAPRLEGEFKELALKKGLYLIKEGVDFTQGQSYFFIGSRSKNKSKRDFLPTLTEYIKGGLEQYSKFGLKGWVVYADDEYFFSFMNWSERTAADLATMDERGQTLQKTLESVVVPFMNAPLKGVDQQAESGEFVRIEL